jgi:pentatricopeptide repeat protein
MLSLFARTGDFRNSIALLDNMTANGLKPDLASFNIALHVGIAESIWFQVVDARW